LADIILAHVKGCVVDIGIGPSTEVLLKHAKEFNISHYSCDINAKKCEWARRVGCKAYEGRSLDFIKELDDPPVALVFIDGEHLYKTVKQEVEFFLLLLSYGGIIFLHDTNPPEKYRSNSGSGCGDVYKLRQELEGNKELQIFTWPYTAAKCGLTMIMKGVKMERW
jgi:predicted O-methyltransferase YrrM